MALNSEKFFYYWNFTPIINLVLFFCIYFLTVFYLLATTFLYCWHDEKNYAEMFIDCKSGIKI